MSLYKNQPASARQSPTPQEPQFVCCKCNELIDGAQTRRKTTFEIVCGRGHPAIQLRPLYLCFLRGLTFAILVVVGTAIFSVQLPNSHVALVGSAMAGCSGFACTRILQANIYSQMPTPSSKLARQTYVEAMGVFAGVLIANLFVFQ